MIAVSGLVILLLLKPIIEQSGTSVPTVRKQAFVSSLTKKRCGVRDTVASVPATFLLLFSSPEKRRYPFKASPFGRGGAVYCDGEGCMWRANAVFPYRAHNLVQPVGDTCGLPFFILVYPFSDIKKIPRGKP